jgi:SulP family sulfate permease
MIVLLLAAALTGILLLALGFARAGGAIRFVPYPVIGGFLSATGFPRSPLHHERRRPG